MTTVPPIELPNKNTILDELVQQVRKDFNLGTTYEEIERTLLICGSDSVGKTTLTVRLLEVPDDITPTAVLDYSCGVKNNLENPSTTDVCHVWELASGATFSSLLSKVKIGSDLSIVLMLDLSEPNKLWNTIQTLLKSVKEYIMSRNDARELKSRSLKFVDDSHTDKSFFKPYPAPLIIIGGKYDKFQKFEPEKKKIICKCLRFIAHICCAYLFFYSEKDNDLVKRAKDVLGQYGFGIKKTVPGVKKDHNTALLIPPGSDSLENIRGSSQVKLESLEDCKKLLNSYFPQEDSSKQYMRSDPKDDVNFKEPRLDALRKQKDEELNRYLQDMEARELQEQV